MKIDYRKEVDSGYDRKIVTERILMELLRNNVPIETITETSAFNIRHREMANNLKKGKNYKLERMEEIYDTIYEKLEDALDKSWSDPVHPIPELYPMTKQEEFEKFSQRDQLNIEIKEAKKAELKTLSKTKQTLIATIKKMESTSKFKKIHTIITEMDTISKEKNITPKIMENICKKHKVTPSELRALNALYQNYQKLQQELKEIEEQIQMVKDGKIVTAKIAELTNMRDTLETELIRRNIKLINYFIREKLNFFLVEQEEIYQICLIALGKAVRNYRVTSGYRFSSLAWTCIYRSISSNFKTLTGYSWRNYWSRRKLKIMLDTVSEALGKQATIEDLYELGLLNMSQKIAQRDVDVPDAVLPESYIYSAEEVNQFPFSFEDYEEIDNYEDEIDSQFQTTETQVEDLALNKVLETSMSSILWKLQDRERIILTLKYGLNREIYFTEQERLYYGMEKNGLEMTFEEIGNYLDISRVRAYQIEKYALRRLRHPSRQKKLEAFWRDK